MSDDGAAGRRGEADGLAGRDPGGDGVDRLRARDATDDDPPVRAAVEAWPASSPPAMHATRTASSTQTTSGTTKLHRTRSATTARPMSTSELTNPNMSAAIVTAIHDQ